MAALGSQSIASSYEQLLHVDADGGGNSTTHVSVKDGDNGTTFGFTIASDALMMSSTNRLEFGDTGTYIHQSADGVLDLVSDTELELNATTIDINGAVEISGHTIIESTSQFRFGDSGTYIYQSADGVLDLVSDTEIELNATTLDINAAVDISGATQFNSTVTVGEDDQGYDVIFYGDTASSNMTWDTSADDLILNDSRLLIDQDDNDTCFSIDAENTTNNAALIQCDALTTAHAFKVSSDSSSSATRDLVRFVNDNTGATATNVLFLDQDADHNGIVIDTEATTGYGIHVDSPAMTTGQGIRIDSANSLTTGKIAYFHSNSSDNSSRNLLQVTNDHASATSTVPLYVQSGAASKAMIIDQNGNANSIEIDSEATSATIFSVPAPTSTTGDVINIDDADALTTGRMIVAKSGSSDTNDRNLVMLINDHSSASGAIVLNLKQDADTTALYTTASHSTHAGNIYYINASGRSSNSGFSFLTTFTGGDSDAQHKLRGDGAVLADAAYDSGGADYAEYFESKDGKAIAIGTTVKLDGEKVVACGEGETPMGVVRPYGNSVVIGNSEPLKWQGKYLKDDYGAYVMEEYTVTEWVETTDTIKSEAIEAVPAVLYEEGDNIPEGKKVGDVRIKEVPGKAASYETKDHQYNTDEIPSDVTVPDDAIVTSTEEDGSKLMRKKKNPDYDESKTYTPREKRDEWCLIGLLGQIPVTKGQPMASNWVKMKDVSDTVEMYFVK